METYSGLDRFLWPAAIALGLLIVVFQFTNLDVALQDHFFDVSTGSWMVDEREPVGRALFYDGPKLVITLVGVGLLAMALGPAAWRQRLRFRRRDLWVAVLTLVTLPVVAAVGKVATNMMCPKDVRRYGGSAPYVKLCSPYPENDRPPRGGRCFPASHAAGGFALIGLAWLRSGRRWRWGAIALGLGAGWTMGFYQILKGAHYLSDTLATMLLAWIVVLAWRRFLRVATVTHLQRTLA